jgi:outer membrane receptor protein involved in Fe transport
MTFIQEDCPMSARSPHQRRTSLRQALPRREPLSLAIAAALASSFATTTQAQPADTETIVVTATRRELSVQDIPLNIAAFDDSLLEAREISDLAELGRSVPGLYVIDQGKRSANSIVVRGLNLNPFQSAEFLGNSGGETVATYVGEVPLYVDLSLNDIERVEVLLGPQGTLYGAGTLGGAIRYIPRKPEFEDFNVSVRASTFDLSQSDSMGARTGGTVNVPLSDNLAFRASIDRYNDPGFIDTPYLVRQSGVSDPEPNSPALVAANLYGDKDVDSEDTTAARVGLRWQPSDNVDATFTYHYQNMDVGGRTQNHRLAFGTGLYESATRYAEPSERTNELLSAEVVADLGFAELTSATGWSKYDELGQRDQTDLLLTLEFSYEAFPSFSAFTREIEREETFTQEIRLVSKGAGKLSWIGGLFFQDFEQPNGDSREFTPGYDAYLGTSRPDSLEYISVLYEDLTEKALFGEIGVQITDRWDVSFGARYYDFSFDTLGDQDTPLFNTFFFGAGPDEINLSLNATTLDDSGSLFKFNTSYRFSDDALGYFTISEGYRFGAANGIAACEVPLPPSSDPCAMPEEFQYFPDTTTNYEVGLRSQWADGRLTLNGALYYIDWQDPQLASATVVGAQPITKNGEGAQTSGIELSLDANVTDRFNLGFSYSHSKAELTDIAPDLIRCFEPPGFGSCAADEFIDGQPGDRLPGSPEDQATVYLAYDWTLSSRWDMTLNYGISAIGDIITTTGLRGDGETLGGFSLHHASAVFSSNGPWEFSIYAQNLLDKYAVTGIRSRRSFVQTVADENGAPVRVRSYAEQIVRPREIGFRFSWNLEPSARRGN